MALSFSLFFCQDKILKMVKTTIVKERKVMVRFLFFTGEIDKNYRSWSNAFCLSRSPGTFGVKQSPGPTFLNQANRMVKIMGR